MTSCLTAIQSYNRLERVLYSPLSTSSYHKKSCQCPPMVTWSQSGCLATCLHLWPLAKHVMIMWSPFAMFAIDFPKISMGKPAGNIASCSCLPGWLPLISRGWLKWLPDGWSWTPEDLYPQRHYFPCTEESRHLLMGHVLHPAKVFLSMLGEKLNSIGRQLFQPVPRDKRELKSRQRAEKQHSEVKSAGCSGGWVPNTGPMQVSLPAWISTGNILSFWDSWSPTP